MFFQKPAYEPTYTDWIGLLRPIVVCARGRPPGNIRKEQIAVSVASDTVPGMRYKQQARAHG